MILICPVQWSIRLAGSSSVLAGTGDGTGRPRELYLCTTSSRLYEAVIKHNLVQFYCCFPCAAFRFAVEGRFSEGMNRGTIKVLFHLKWFGPIRSLYTRPGSISTPQPRPSNKAAHAPRVFLPSLLLVRPASMCIECFPPELIKLTLKDHNRFYRLVGGRRCNNLNHGYVMPADEDELRVSSRINDVHSDDEIKMYNVHSDSSFFTG
jgi:hypothetical protein